MSALPLAKVVQSVRHTVLKQPASSASDAHLLRTFIQSRDEAAFETLVRRHGPMVLSVCRRMLHSVHDAEDAFQATFLVLARRATSVRPHGMLSNWLYGVARRTALRARRNVLRRAEVERAVMPRIEPQRLDAAELAELLDQEIARMPDKLRIALLLCDVQGRTRREAARELGLPEGTVASRVARGRTLLARRLARQGLALSAGSLAVSVAQQAIAEVPAALVNTTVQAVLGKAAIAKQAAFLTEGVLRAMMIAKLKNVLTIVLALGLVICSVSLSGGTATVSGQPGAEKPAIQQDKPAPQPAQPTLKVRVEIEALDAVGRTLDAVDISKRIVVAPAVLELRLDGQEGKKIRVKIDNIELKRKAPRFVNLPIAKDATITDAGKEAKLADLKPGRAELELAAGPSGLHVVAIRAEAKKTE